MKKEIEVCEKKIEYTLRISKRARRMRLAVYCDGSCVVTVPRTMNENLVEKFIIEKAQWVINKIDLFKKSGYRPRKINSKAEFLQHKARAFEIVKNRIGYFNQFYNFRFNSINIKNQKTRWGSCSKKGNLNFNYKIALITPEMADYIVVHELCHLGEFNHSQNFWGLVSKTLPNYLEIKNQFKKINI
jgi:hypothetical protein